MHYSGYLQKHDPLYGYFHDVIQPKLDMKGDRDYRVFHLQASNSVYLYEETKTLTRLIGKFYYPGVTKNRSSAHAAMTREFANLEYMRSMGFSGPGNHYIARPLGYEPGLNELLVEECCYGESLSSVLRRSIQNRDHGLLYSKLTALACFLSRFHNRTAQPGRVDFLPAAEYAEKILRTLHSHGWLSSGCRENFQSMMKEWNSRPEMRSDNPVIVHGDATPENFLFGDGLHVISFDLERMRCADRLFDLGRLTAELGHFFMLYAGDRTAAEPFTGHFLWEYCCHFPDRMAAFRAITKRVPCYMGINFLRIARNSYFDRNYRQRLIRAAYDCLKGGLK